MTKDFFESVDVVVAQKLVGNLILLIRTLERSPSRSLHARFLNRVCEVACVCVGVVRLLLCFNITGSKGLHRLVGARVAELPVHHREQRILHCFCWCSQKDPLFDICQKGFYLKGT